MADNDDSPTLEYSHGDACDREHEGEVCGHKIHVREYERNPQLLRQPETDLIGPMPLEPCEPEGPVAEAICPIDGIVDKI